MNCGATITATFMPMFRPLTPDGGSMYDHIMEEFERGKITFLDEPEPDLPMSMKSFLLGLDDR